MEIQRICTLCMRKCETFNYIERNTKNILDLFLPEMDFTTIQGPVMCGNCAETLSKCFEFKTTCLHTYDYLVSFVNNKDGIKLDLNDLFQSKSVSATGIPEDQDICGFCMGLVKNCNAIPLYIKDEDHKLDKMVQQCLPELDLSVIKDPVICADCHSSLVNCFRFVTDCLISVQRIRQDRVNLDISSKGQIGLSDLLCPAIKAENTNDVGSDLFDIVKIEKQICEDGGNLEQIEVVNGVNIIKLEETSCINDNSNNNNENANESLMALDNPTVSNEQQWSPKNVLVWEEDSNNLGAIKIEETLCEENEPKCKDVIFVEVEDNKSLINEEIEMKTGHDFNRFEEGVVMTKPNINVRLNEKCLMPTLEEELSEPPVKQRFKKNATRRMTYHCKRCSFRTKNRRNLDKHLLTHKCSKLTMYSCHSCSFQTEHKNSLEEHMLVHTNSSKETTCKCLSCTFQEKHGSLSKHSLKHKNPEITMYKCDSCPYQTWYRRFLDRHSLTHKERPEVKLHKCDSCTYQAKYKYEVVRHSWRHKDPCELTMYNCEFCLYQTKYKGNFVKHSLKHKDPSEVAMHKCDSCTFKTRYKHVLNSHLLKHKQA